MEVIELITAVVSLLVAVATSVIAILTKVKAIKDVEKVETVNEHMNRLKTLSDKINEYAIVAEANGGTGEEKKLFVLKSIEAVCNELGWDYDEQWVSTTLELVIDLTNKINVKKDE